MQHTWFFHAQNATAMQWRYWNKSVCLLNTESTEGWIPANTRYVL